MKSPFMLAVLCLAATGCATMVNRSTESIGVTSNPPGAVVSVDCGNVPLYGGLTPTTIKVPRTAESCSITVAKEGFAEEHIDFEKQPSRATVMNEVPGVVAGSILSAAAFLFSWSDDHVDGDLVVDAYRGGHWLGSNAGNAVDHKTGAAYKWVPGNVVVNLQKLPEE